ncbi:fatty acid efflux pump transcriptional regulator FarR [Barrientosiimonas marina]|uniref:TetR/AcrR family transcriptional regulator n=1 Tax=Lentibacillus kimchii TaxID=1542911 RepID=A0ABW2UUC7_9BACI
MNQNDLRVIKTKNLLSTSLFHLLEENGLSSITIKMICDNALVHRTTFYKHFQDKYDLLVYLFKGYSKNYFELDIKTRINSPIESINYIITSKIKGIQQKQKKEPEFHEILTNYFVGVLENDIQANIKRFRIDSNVPESLIIYIYRANLDAILKWARENKINKTSQELDQIFHQVIKMEI